MGTLIGTQIADLLSNLEVYISDTVTRINNWFGTSIDAAQVIEQFNDPNGAVQNFISAQRGDALRLTGRALNGLFATFSIVLFTFYFVADGPRMRRAICSRLRPTARAVDLGTRNRQDRRISLFTPVAKRRLGSVPRHCVCLRRSEITDCSCAVGWSH